MFIIFSICSSFLNCFDIAFSENHKLSLTNVTKLYKTKQKNKALLVAPRACRIPYTTTKYWRFGHNTHFLSSSNPAQYWGLTLTDQQLFAFITVNMSVAKIYISDVLLLPATNINKTNKKCIKSIIKDSNGFNHFISYVFI